MVKLTALLRTLQTGQLWYVLPHHYYLWRRSKDIERTAPVVTAPYGAENATEVHILTGQKQHIDLIYAAKSFVLHYQAPIVLIIHGDTSLTDEAIHRLERHFPQSLVLTRQKRDQLIQPQLEANGLMKCAEFRQANPLAAKLIDAYLLSRSDRFILLDTDCLAFKPLDRLQSLATDINLKNVFSRDPLPNPYSLPSDKLYSYFKVSVKPHLNVGLCMIYRDSIDLNLVEKFLSINAFPMNDYFAEQTIIAVLVSQGSVDLLPENEYNTARLLDEKTCNFIHYCGHYLSKTRISMRKIGQQIVLNQLCASD